MDDFDPMAAANNSVDVQDVLSQSAANPAYFKNRTGGNAIGMTAEFDASHEQAAERIRQMYYKNDPKGFAEYQKMRSISLNEQRNTIRKYEVQQAMAYAKTVPTMKLNDVTSQFDNWVGPEIQRIRIATEDKNAELAKLSETEHKQFNDTVGKDATEAQVKAGNDEITKKYDAMQREQCSQLFDGQMNSVVNKFDEMMKNMHFSLVHQYKLAGYTDAEAYNLATLDIAKKSKAMISGYAASGQIDLANRLIGKYEDTHAADLPEYEMEKNKDGTDKLDKNGAPIIKMEPALGADGNPLPDGNGGVVMRKVLKKDKDGNIVWKQGVTNPSGRLWMSTGDVADLRNTLNAAAEKNRRQAAYVEKQNEEAVMLNADKLNTAGLSLLSNPDGTYNPDELDIVINGGIVNGKKVTGLSELAMNAPTSKAARHVTSIIKDLQTSAKQMSRRVKNWDEMASTLKTTSDYLSLLYDIKRQGNVGGLTALTYGGQEITTPANVDCYQKMIALVKNGIARGKLKKEEYGDNGTSEFSIKNLRNEFGKTNWNEAAQWLYKANGDFCGGKIEIDMDRTKAMYLASLREKGETDFKNQVERWEMDQYKFSGIWEVNQETGERTLPDAKYYWFKYTLPNGNVIHLSGDDMETLSKGVHEFQMRNVNPSDMDNGNTSSFISGIFNKIISDGAMKVGTGADTTLKRGAMSQIVGDSIRDYYSPTRGITGVDIHTVGKIVEDFDPFIQATERADFSKMYKTAKTEKKN